jgi:AraC-like DNA-binding protein
MAVRAVVAGVEDAGVTRERFLADAGLPARAIDDGAVRMSWRDYLRVIRTALHSSGDPALGLHMGERASTSWFDVIGHLAQHSTDLRSALGACVRYSRLATDGPRLALTEEGELAVVRLTHLQGDAPEVRFICEFALTALLLHLILRYAERGVQPTRVCFAHAAPAHHAEYRRIFGGRERFGQSDTGIAFERSWLDRKQLHHSPELHELLRSRAELLLSRLDTDASATERVRRWLGSHDLQNKPSMEEIARSLGMSGRSLRRRLTEEGTHFSELVEAARALGAQRMLEDPRFSVQEAAYALGFSTHAAFTRAFKRWTGKSPSAYRAARAGLGAALSELPTDLG